MVVKCTKLVFSPVNALTFKITGGTKSIKEHEYRGRIVSLECPDNLIIGINDVIPVKNTHYRINYIIKERSKKSITYFISTDKRTKASMFLMPLFKGNKNMYFWNRLFVNCFIATDTNDKCIALLYRWSKDPLFTEFEKSVPQIKGFKTVYDIDPSYVLFIFDVIPEYHTIYNQFINGQYSKFAREYKLDILDFHRLNLDSQIGQILFKDEKRRKLLEEKLGAVLEYESELYSKPTKKEETFNPEKYI